MTLILYVHIVNIAGSIYTMNCENLAWCESAEKRPQVARHSHSASLAGDYLLIFGGISHASSSSSSTTAGDPLSELSTTEVKKPKTRPLFEGFFQLPMSAFDQKFKKN